MLDENDHHYLGARSALRQALERGDALALPASPHAECLVAPTRTGRDAIHAVELVR